MKYLRTPTQTLTAKKYLSFNNVFILFTFHFLTQIVLESMNEQTIEMHKNMLDI